jgi:monoamine oxidase
MAGLAAADAARHAGADVVVLEARDRVGGRTLTSPIEGGRGRDWIDLGGQWIGPTQHEISALVAELGFSTFPTWTKGHNLLLLGGHPKRYRGTIPRLPLRALIEVGLAQLRLDRMAKKVPLDAPWSAPRAAEWDAIALSSWLDAHVKTKVARRLLDAALETVFAAGGHELSLLHALFYIHSGKNLDMLLGTTGAAQATRVVGGMQPVAQRLAASLDVRLSSPVRRITQDGEGVTVSYEGGELRAARVVIAIPPKLVTEIEFSPALPPRRAELAARMPMGAVIKCTAVYERPFWRDAGLSGMVVSDEGPLHVVFDNSPPDAGPGILMGFAEAAEARALGQRTEAERRASALACFARYFGERARSAVHYADHVWEHDRWSGGCYGAFMPPGVWTSLGPLLREPVDRIHWAGTETAAVWSGYIDGAISSGKRAAAEIMRAGITSRGAS